MLQQKTGHITLERQLKRQSMKKIILFTGEVETLGYFSLQLAKAFEKLGHEVLVFDFLEEEKSFLKLQIFREDKNTVMVTFNFSGIRQDEIFHTEDGALFWDRYQIPCYNIVVDHPFYYHELIRKRPKLYRQICIDRDHMRYMERFFPDVRLCPFLPLGGTQLKDRREAIPLPERPIEIIFTGNYTPPHTFDQHITRIDEEYTAFYRSIIDALIANPDLAMEEVFESFLKQEIPEITEDELAACMENMIFIDLYIRFYFRGLVVRTLADQGFRVHVFGKGWNRLECEHPENIIDGDTLDSYGCLQMISKAKISLNVMPWFKDGAHDRIFNSMLNGAICLTDTSRYLTKILQKDKEVKFYSLKEINQLPEIVKQLLSDPEGMEQVVQMGYERAVGYHTWGCRAEVLSQWIEEEGKQDE